MLFSLVPLPANYICTIYYTCSLETNGRLMDLNHKDGKLYVNYGERLVTLLREVRQLTALGFAIPAKIQHTSSTGQKFYRHGVILKQVRLQDNQKHRIMHIQE